MGRLLDDAPDTVYPNSTDPYGYDDMFKPLEDDGNDNGD